MQAQISSSGHDRSEEQFVRRLCEFSIATLTKAQSKFGDVSAAGALARGSVLELVGYYSAAAAAYSEACAADATLIEARARQALAYLKAGQGERGLQLIIELAKTNSDFQLKTLATGESFTVLTILGDALVLNNRFDEAVEAFKAARKANGEDNYAAAHLAEIYLAQGKQDLAVSVGNDLTSGSRFDALRSMLGSGAVNVALLQRNDASTLVSSMRVMMPGRPLEVDGEARVAGVDNDREDWCGAIPSEDLRR